MTLLTWLQAASSVGIIAAYYMIPKWPVSGWAMSATSCVLAVVFFVYQEPIMWWFLAMESILAAVAGRNAYNAIHQREAPAVHVA